MGTFRHMKNVHLAPEHVIPSVDFILHSSNILPKDFLQGKTHFSCNRKVWHYS